MNSGNTRTTFKELEYAKKLAAVKNPSNVEELGLPNVKLILVR